MEETWKDIKGYEGLYQASTLGRIRSSYRTCGLDYRVMSPSKSGKYEKIIFLKNKLRKHTLVHRVIAETFIPNPNQYPCVNHINEVAIDNRAQNLEWCTYKQNTNHGTLIQRIADWHKKHSPQRGKRGGLSKSSKSILQISVEGFVINNFGSARDAGRYIGDVRRSGHITQVCRGERQFAYGFIWKYAV